MTITITAGKAGLDLKAYLADYDKNFSRGDSRGSFNEAGFGGSQYVLSEDASLSGDTAARGFIAKGQMSYDLPTHTITGSISSFQFGHGATGNEAAKTFGFAQSDFTLSGLKVEDAAADKHLGALMGGSTAEIRALLAADSIKFTGGAGDDAFTGYGKNDAITGGGGKDTLRGGTGNDALKGDANGDKLYGDAGNDKLGGGDGNDEIWGGAGKDVLAGGIGADKLFGGKDADTFVFDTALSKLNRDGIDDFSVKDDSIQLSGKHFKGLPKDGKHLDDSGFAIGAGAADKDDRIVYDSKKGELSYDADGSGSKAQVLFATVDGGLKMTAADFLVV